MDRDLPQSQTHRTYFVCTNHLHPQKAIGSFEKFIRKKVMNDEPSQGVQPPSLKKGTANAEGAKLPQKNLKKC
jgi:hypothetical protein